jgi:lysozyme family protein
MTDLAAARAHIEAGLAIIAAAAGEAISSAETVTVFDLKAELNALIEREGDYVDHPSDKGGPTRFGITEAVARANGYAGDMRGLPLDVALTIYFKRYWSDPGFNKVADIAPRLAAELFDTGVNMGPRVQVVWLQRWLNGLNRRGRDYADITADGVIGPATLGALKAFLKVRGRLKGEQALVDAVNCSQGHRYLELAEGRPANADFLYGWLTTRIVL